MCKLAQSDSFIIDLLNVGGALVLQSNKIEKPTEGVGSLHMTSKDDPHTCDPYCIAY